MNQKFIEWILRITIAGEFIGHGIFALQLKQGWIKYFTGIGISSEMANQLMPIIGTVDIILAIILLIKPVRGLLLWMVIWAFATALIRPISGDPIWDFIERWANWGAPLALLLMYGWPKNIKEWFLPVNKD